MSHGARLEDLQEIPPQVPAASAGVLRIIAFVNDKLLLVSMIALVLGGAILSLSVMLRYFFKVPTDWQDEASVFLLVGATFLSGSYVQSFRGHVAIEAFGHLLPPRVNRIRLIVVDFLSTAFCAFFSWKSWTLFHEAVREHQTTTSTWSPPLAIPYGGMSLGMTLLTLQVALQFAARFTGEEGPEVTTATVGMLYGAATLIVMFMGVPIAFALGVVATTFMYFFMPASSLDTVTQNVYEEMASITLLSIPLFILKGAAIGKSPAGKDLYSAIHVWVHKIPGGLGIANVFACALFAAMAGSSPATCSAIGTAGIPEMRMRGYSGRFAAGIIAAGGTLGILLPPSITMILYAVASEQSLGRLFLAGIGPAFLLVVLFSGYAMYRYKKEYRAALATFDAGGQKSAYLAGDEYTLRERLKMLPRVLPFVVLLTGVMIALYGGYATPSETAGLGALLAFVLIAIVYRIWTPKQLRPILTSTLKDSTMLMFIIGMSLLYSYVMSYLHISQSAAEWVVQLGLSRWVLLAAILVMVVVLGFFLPPVSIILMTAPIILPPLKGAGFDLVWFGVVMTIVMEMGLIHPPVGLNIFVIKNVAPDIPLSEVVWGVVPFVLLMMVAVVLLCWVPGIANWLPNAVM